MTRTSPAPLWLDLESDLPQKRSVSNWMPFLFLVAMTVAFAAFFSWVDVLRHQAFQTHAFDLGNMDQALWSTLHGDLLRFTSMSVHGSVLTTRLAIHVEPILLPISLLYLIHDGPETLLVLQACVVALGTVPAYLLARKALGMPWLALVFPLAYLLHPSLQHAVVYEFHAVTLSACLLLWTLYFAYVEHAPGFVVCAILAAATKEEIGLLVAACGLIFLVRRRWYMGFMTIVCGLGWTSISLLLIIPHFNPAGQSPYVERYSYLGHSLSGFVREILHRPQFVAQVLVSAPRLDYLNRLLHPLGFVPLLGAPVLLLALPSLLINMLSDKPEMYSGFYQYSAPIVPFVITAAILGTAAAARFAREHRVLGADRIPLVLSLLVLAGAILEARRYGSSPIAAVQRSPAVGPHQRLEEQFLQVIPAAVPVSASDEIEPHLAHRLWIYVMPVLHPDNGPAAHYLALDASIPTWPIRPAQQHAAVVRALHGLYGVERARDGILILSRGATRKALPRAFYSFLFHQGSRVTSTPARWGPLRLTGFTIPRPGTSVNPMVPTIDVDTYWRATRPLPQRARIALYISPVYQGSHPRFSSRWRAEWGSPAWDWLPLSAWPRGRTIHAASVPLRPDLAKHGKVDIAVAVWGLGPVRGASPRLRMNGVSRLLRLATVDVGG